MEFEKQFDEKIRQIVVNAFADTSKNWRVTFECTAKPGEGNDEISPLEVIVKKTTSLISQVIEEDRKSFAEKIKGLRDEKIVKCPLTEKEQKEFDKDQFFGIGQANMALRYEMKIDKLLSSIQSKE